MSGQRAEESLTSNFYSVWYPDGEMKQLATKIRTYISKNTLELYVAVLAVIGLPLIAYIYVDWRLALAVFIAVQLVPAFLALRSSK